MRFMQRSLMGLFLLSLTLGILALAGMSVRTAVSERMAKKPPSRPVRERVFSVDVLRASKTTATPLIETYGEIRSRRSLDIRAPVAGTIIMLAANFVEGGTVAKGDLLLRLDPADAKSALQSVETDVIEGKAELQQAKAALGLAKDDVAGARAQSDLRAAALARQKNLADRGVGTEASVEAAALAQAAAKQGVLARRQALAQAKARLTRAKTSLSRLARRLADAKRRLENTRIFAEFDGVLGAVNVIEGGLVSPNEKLARLIDPTALEVAFRLSNSQFSRLQSGDTARLGAPVRISLGGVGDGVVARATIDRKSVV